jgi:hypothetical protein
MALPQVAHRGDGLEVVVAVEQQQVVVDRQLCDAAGDRARHPFAAAAEVEEQAGRLGPARGLELDVVLGSQVALQQVPLPLVAAPREQLELGEATEDGYLAGQRRLERGALAGIAQDRDPYRRVDEDDGDASAPPGGGAPVRGFRASSGAAAAQDAVVEA